MGNWYMWLVLSGLWIVALIFEIFGGERSNVVIGYRVFAILFFAALGLAQYFCEKKGESGKKLLKKINIGAIVLSLVLFIIILLWGFGAKRNKSEEQPDKWNCTVVCAEESGENAYVITYSDEKIITDTGQITFQNQNDFAITIHLSGGGKEVYTSEIQAGGNSVYMQADKELTYTVGIHGDVEEGTELKLMVYDGEWSEVW